MRLELSFDDGANHDIRVAELLVKHGLGQYATFYIPSMWQWFGESKGWVPLSFQEFEDLSKNFEIGGHGVFHQYLTKVPYEQAVFEIEKSKKMLEDSIGKPVTKFAYPRGYANDNLRDVVRKHYELGRNTIVGSIEEQDDPAWQHTSLHMGYPRSEYGNKSWYEYGIDLLEKAARRETSVFRAWGHSWEISKQDAWHGVDSFLAELKRALS